MTHRNAMFPTIGFLCCVWILLGCDTYVSSAAGGVINQALEYVLSLPEGRPRNSNLYLIAAYQTQLGEVDAAFQTVKQINNKSWKDNTKQVIVTNLLQCQKEQDLRGIALTIKKSQKRDETLKSIVEGQSGSDIEEAQKTVGFIEDIYVTGEALRSIVASQIKAGNMEAALKTAQSMHQHHHNNWGLADVAIAVAREGDLKRALRIKRTIGSSEARRAVLKAIVANLTTTGKIDEAWELSTRNHSERTTHILLLKIINTQVEAGNFTQALKNVKNIPSRRTRSLALAAITEGQSKEENFEGAMHTSSLIKNESYRERALVAVVRALIKRGDIKQALEVSKTINNRSHKSDALIALSQAVAKTGDRQEAKRLIAAIPEPYRHAQPLTYLAHMEVQRGHLSEAKKILNKIRPFGQLTAHLPIAATLAEQGNMVEALRFVRNIPVIPQEKDSLMSSDFLRGIGWRILAWWEGKRKRTEKSLAWINQIVDPSERTAAFLGLADGLLNRNGMRYNSDGNMEKIS